MLNTVGDIIKEVIVRLSLTTTSTSTAGITDTILNNWLRQAHKWASSSHKWTFTEGRVSTTYTTTEEWNFEGYKADSFRLLQIGGKRVQPITFEDYQRFREETPDSEDRVYSNYNRTLFINPNTDLSGTLTAWGQYEPIIDPTDLTALTIFSGFDEEGNDAIVEKMVSYAKERQQKSNEAKNNNENAQNILDSIWNRTLDEQFQYQTKDRGIFDRIDVLAGSAYNDIINRDQF